MSTSNVSEDDICVGWVVDIARHTCLWARAAGAASAWIHAAPPSHATLNTPASPPALLPPYFDCTGAEVSTLRVRGAPAVRLRTRGQSLYLGFGDDASALKWAVYLSRMAATPPAPPLPAYLLPTSVRDLPPASPSTVAQLEAGLRTRTEPERHPRVLTSSQLPPACTAIHRIQLYATTRRLFLIGEVPAAMGSAAEGTFRVMEIDRTVAAPDSLRSILREHSDTYTAHTIASVIESIYLSAGVPMPTAVAEASTKWRRTMFSADRSFYGSLPGGGTPDGTPPNATSALPGGPVSSMPPLPPPRTASVAAVPGVGAAASVGTSFAAAGGSSSSGGGGFFRSIFGGGGKPKGGESSARDASASFSGRPVDDTYFTPFEAPASDSLLTVDIVALLGAVRFTRGYYLVVVTQRRKLGAIGNHDVYGIADTELIPIFCDTPAPTVVGSKSLLQRLQDKLASADAATLIEDRYESLFMHLDLTKDFFYSYTYDVSRALQQQMVTNVYVNTSMDRPAPEQYVRELLDPPAPPSVSGEGRAAWEASPHVHVDDHFVWNAYLLSEFRDANVSPTWFVRLAHGFFQQVTTSTFGRPLVMTLLARRSRHFAGTRYLKRGISEAGNVANDVETEQIADDTLGGFSSFVQMRGSIPTAWAQRTNITVPKPPILVQPFDARCIPTKRHFAQLLARYGGPVCIVNLVKKKEKSAREKLVGTSYAQAVFTVNKDLPPAARIQYLAYDYSAIVKSKRHNVLAALRDVSRWVASNVGFFCNTAVSPSVHHKRARLQDVPRAVAAPKRTLLNLLAPDTLTTLSEASLAVSAIVAQELAADVPAADALRHFTSPSHRLAIDIPGAEPGVQLPRGPPSANAVTSASVIAPSLGSAWHEPGTITDDLHWPVAATAAARATSDGATNGVAPPPASDATRRASVAGATSSAVRVAHAPFLALHLPGSILRTRAKGVEIRNSASSPDSSSASAAGHFSPSPPGVWPGFRPGHESALSKLVRPGGGVLSAPAPLAGSMLGAGSSTQGTTEVVGGSGGAADASGVSTVYFGCTGMVVSPAPHCGRPAAGDEATAASPSSYKKRPLLAYIVGEPCYKYTPGVPARAGSGIPYFVAFAQLSHVPAVALLDRCEPAAVAALADVKDTVRPMVVNAASLAAARGGALAPAWLSSSASGGGTGGSGLPAGANTSVRSAVHMGVRSAAAAAAVSASNASAAAGARAVALQRCGVPSMHVYCVASATPAFPSRPTARLLSELGASEVPANVIDVEVLRDEDLMPLSMPALSPTALDAAYERSARARSGTSNSSVEWNATHAHSSSPLLGAPSYALLAQAAGVHGSTARGRMVRAGTHSSLGKRGGATAGVPSPGATSLGRLDVTSPVDAGSVVSNLASPARLAGVGESTVADSATGGGVPDAGSPQGHGAHASSDLTAARMLSASHTHDAVRLVRPTPLRGAEVGSSSGGGSGGGHHHAASAASTDTAAFGTFVAAQMRRAAGRTSAGSAAALLSPGVPRTVAVSRRVAAGGVVSGSALHAGHLPAASSATSTSTNATALAQRPPVQSLSTRLRERVEWASHGSAQSSTSNDTSFLHERDPSVAAVASGCNRYTLCCSAQQDSSITSAEGVAKVGIAVRMREFQNVGGSAEYFYVNLQGMTHGYHHEAPSTLTNEAALLRTAQRALAASGGADVSLHATQAYPLLGTRFQAGVARTNCIDCMDRTNVGQVCIGVHMFGLQLYAMGLGDTEMLDPAGALVRELMDMYENMGDHIAMQYGGSEANKKVTTAEHAEGVRVGDAMEQEVVKSGAGVVSVIGRGAASTLPNSALLNGARPSRLGGNSATELLSSLQRYYANSFTDSIKQASINLFLGLYKPWKSSFPLWELDTDHYLHNASMLQLSDMASDLGADVTGDWWLAPMQRFMARGLPRVRVATMRTLSAEAAASAATDLLLACRNIPALGSVPYSATQYSNASYDGNLPEGLPVVTGIATPATSAVSFARICASEHARPRPVAVHQPSKVRVAALPSSVSDAASGLPSSGEGAQAADAPSVALFNPAPPLGDEVGGSNRSAAPADTAATVSGAGAFVQLADGNSGATTAASLPPRAPGVRGGNAPLARGPGAVPSALRRERHAREVADEYGPSGDTAAATAYAPSILDDKLSESLFADVFRSWPKNSVADAAAAAAAAADAPAAPSTDVTNADAEADAAAAAGYVLVDARSRSGSMLSRTGAAARSLVAGAGRLARDLTSPASHVDTPPSPPLSSATGQTNVAVGAERPRRTSVESMMTALQSGTSAAASASYNALSATRAAVAAGLVSDRKYGVSNVLPAVRRGGIALPPWLAHNPNAVVDANGSVRIVAKEERMDLVASKTATSRARIHSTAPPASASSFATAPRGAASARHVGSVFAADAPGVAAAEEASKAATNPPHAPNASVSVLDVDEQLPADAHVWAMERDLGVSNSIALQSPDMGPLAPFSSLRSPSAVAAIAAMNAQTVGSGSPFAGPEAAVEGGVIVNALHYPNAHDAAPYVPPPSSTSRDATQVQRVLHPDAAAYASYCALGRAAGLYTPPPALPSHAPSVSSALADAAAGPGGSGSGTPVPRFAPGSDANANGLAVSGAAASGAVRVQLLPSAATTSLCRDSVASSTCWGEQVDACAAWTQQWCMSAALASLHDANITPATPAAQVLPPEMLTTAASAMWHAATAAAAGAVSNAPSLAHSLAVYEQYLNADALIAPAQSVPLLLLGSVVDELAPRIV